jgi:hypothetical protein
VALDRKFGGVVGQAPNRAGQARGFGHVDEQVVDRMGADGGEHGFAVVAGKR